MAVLIRFAGLATLAALAGCVYDSGCVDGYEYDESARCVPVTGDIDMGVPPGTDGGPGRDSGPTGTDLGATVEPVDCGDCSFVITRLAMPPEPTDGIRAGLNQDGRVSDDSDSTTCFRPDATSPRGETGVDNELAALRSALETVLGDLDTVLADNDSSFAFQIADWNGETDPSLGLDVYAGSTSGPTFTATRTMAGSGSAEGHFVRGSTGQMVPISLGEDETGSPVRIMLHDVAVGVNMASLADGGTSVGGVLVGTIDIEQASQAIGNATDAITPEMVRSIIRSFGDMQRNAAEECEHISVGLPFTANTIDIAP